MIEDRLAAAGFHLPAPRTPAFAYVPVVVHRGVAYVSGQLPWDGDQLHATGLAGAGVTVEVAQACARLCTLQALAALKAEIGSLDHVERVLKVTGFVASAPGFAAQPTVIDAASQLLGTAFGDAGRHARSAVGVAALPRGVPVEIEFTLAVRG